MARFELIKAHEGFVAFLKIVTVLVLLGWILIWMFALCRMSLPDQRLAGTNRLMIFLHIKRCLESSFFRSR